MAAGNAEGAFGPVQLLVLSFDGDQFDGSILRELESLGDRDIVRLVDLLFVRKDEQGELEAFQVSDLDVEQAEELGAVAGALIGLGAGGEEGAERGAVAGAVAGSDGHLIDENEAWYVADAIPEGSAAAIVLLEHRWAIGLREATEAARGELLAEEWIHPLDLVAIGLIEKEQVPGGAGD